MTAIDMMPFIAPKSDRLNADDLLGGDITITITGVKINSGAENPCEINYEGDNGKPWYPCKTMGRVLVKAWGPDAKNYTGKSLRLFRDPKVTWAGMQVGGIRIRALSHIDGAFEMALTETRGKKVIAGFSVLSGAAQTMPTDDPARKWADGYLAAVTKAGDADELNAFANAKAGKLAELAGKRPELHEECVRALDARRAALAGGDFSDDAPPYAEAVARIREMTGNAMGQQSWEAAKAEFLKHAPALPEEVRSELEREVHAKRVELGAPPAEDGALDYD